MIKRTNLIALLLLCNIQNSNAQWLGSSPSPLTTNSDVGIGNVVFLAGTSMGIISNPLGQLHISDIRPSQFGQGTPMPKPQIYLTSYCESPWALNPYSSTNYSLESDCYSGDLKVNNINGSNGNVFSLVNLNTNKVGINTENFNVKDYFSVAGGSIGIINASLPFVNTSSISGAGLHSSGNCFVQGDVSVNNNTYLWGKVRIGGGKWATYHPDAKVHVNGKIAAQHFVITKPSNWSDKVFKKGYNLMTLLEIEKYIEENEHLPEVPSEDEIMEKGYDTNEMDALLLQKIEELTLHMIEMKKENSKLTEEVLKLKNK